MKAVIGWFVHSGVAASLMLMAIVTGGISTPESVAG